MLASTFSCSIALAVRNGCSTVAKDLRMMQVQEEIERRLIAALQPLELSIVDESHRHVGHAGARPGGQSHFRLRIVAAAFAGQTRLQRQRIVYAALGDLMTRDVHALAMTALAPDEAEPDPSRPAGG